MQYECPAEAFIERVTRGCNYYYLWEVCQPDACWGVWHSGKEDTREKALSQARSWLAVVHREQGF